MKHPNFNEEKKLWKKGYKFVAGLDEAGRGPLAGPVVAACVNFQFSIYNFQSIFNDTIFKQVKDSKKLSPPQREKIYKALIKHPQIKYGVGAVSEKVIDRINILNAAKLAMKKAIASCEPRAHKKIDFLLIDGNFKLEKVKIPQKSVVKGDEKVFSIAAASIIAKVTRDRLMKKYHKKYPEYGFAMHKGYGTKAHFSSLEKFGPCKIHRKTFYPISALENNLKKSRPTLVGRAGTFAA